MTLRRRLARLREACRDPDRPPDAWALWIEVFYAEPYGTPRFGVAARFQGGRESEVLGRGRSIRAAVRQAEKTIEKCQGITPLLKDWTVLDRFGV